MNLFSVVALIFKNGQVLACSRKDNHADLGLPGGKIEPTDDGPEAAIRREVEEETTVILQKMAPCFDHLDRVEGSERRPCRCFLVTEWTGEPKSVEGAWVGWVPMERLLEPSCSFHEYNRALFKALGLLPA